MLSKGLFFLPGPSGASMKCSLCYPLAPQEKGNNPSAVFQTIDILAMTSFAIKITNCANAFYNSPLLFKRFCKKMSGRLCIEKVIYAPQSGGCVQLNRPSKVLPTAHSWSFPSIEISLLYFLIFFFTKISISLNGTCGSYYKLSLN